MERVPADPERVEDRLLLGQAHRVRPGRVGACRGHRERSRARRAVDIEDPQPDRARSHRSLGGLVVLASARMREARRRSPRPSAGVGLLDVLARVPEQGDVGWRRSPGNPARPRARSRSRRPSDPGAGPRRAACRTRRRRSCPAAYRLTCPAGRRRSWKRLANVWPRMPDQPSGTVAVIRARGCRGRDRTAEGVGAGVEGKDVGSSGRRRRWGCGSRRWRRDARAPLGLGSRTADADPDREQRARPRPRA